MSEPRRARLWQRRRVTLPAALVGFTVLAVLCKLPVWEAPLHRYSSLAGQSDPLQAMWFLNWTPFALSHGHNPLLTTYVNYPRGVNLLWNTSVPALGVLFWPFTAAWGPILSENLITTLAPALAAFFAFIVIRRYVRGDAAALIGGLLYGFCPYMIAQDVTHDNLVATAIMLPLGLLLLDELLVRQRMRSWLLGLCVAAFAVFQFFVNEEFVVTEIIVAALVTVILALLRRREARARAPYAVKALGVGTALAIAVLVVPVVAIQLRGPNRVAGFTYDPSIFVTDLANLVVPTPVQLISPGWARSISGGFTGNISEWDGYLGLPLLVLLVATTTRCWRVSAVRVAGVTAAAVTVFSLGPYLHIGGRQTAAPLPWWIPAHLPLLQDIQPNRLMIFVWLCAALLLAFALERLWAARRNPAMTGALLAVVAVPLIPSLPLPWQPYSVPSYFASPAVREIPDGSVVLTIPCACPFDMSGLNWQEASGMRFRVIGGTGYFLGATAVDQEALYQVGDELAGGTPEAALPPSQRAAFLQELRDNHVGAVLLGPVPQQARAARIVSDILGAQPQSRGEVEVWMLSPGT